jgi:hypothetical protein
MSMLWACIQQNMASCGCHHTCGGLWGGGTWGCVFSEVCVALRPGTAQLSSVLRVRGGRVGGAFSFGLYSCGMCWILSLGFTTSLHGRSTGRAQVIGWDVDVFPIGCCLCWLGLGQSDRTARLEAGPAWPSDWARRAQ